jgi:tRNA pseudouridine38-40 synthase
MLPDDISIFVARIVDTDFHARFSALDRSYVYYIYNHPQPAATLAGMTTWVNFELDASAMHESAQALLGEQNFSAFRSSQCQSHSRHRFVSNITVSRHGDLVMIQITANAFLHHMVRNIVGSLIEVGRGSQHKDWMGELLATEDRTRAGVTAPPDGLYLCRVRYPEQYQVSEDIRYPLLLAANFS